MPSRSPTRRAALASASFWSVSFWVLGIGPADAHAILEESQPADRGRVPAGAVPLRLRFNSRIDRARSRLRLTRPDQTKFDPAIEPDGPPDLVTTVLTLTPGAHTLRWQVLAVDGHITRGAISFTVTER